MCNHSNLGTVGNDQASTIKCTCPVEIDRIEYDTLKQNWILELKDDPESSQLNLQTVINNCNPARDTNYILKYFT